MLDHLARGNQEWADDNTDSGILSDSPESPTYLWIGCSESHMSPNDLLELDVGDLVVHRNLGGLVLSHDMGMWATIHYALEQLHVTHIIVCTHTNCTLFKEMERTGGPLDAWMCNVKDVLHKGHVGGDAEHVARQSALNVGKSSLLHSLWEVSKPITVHAWTLDDTTGKITDTGVLIKGFSDVDGIYIVEPAEIETDEESFEEEIDLNEGVANVYGIVKKEENASTTALLGSTDELWQDISVRTSFDEPSLNRKSKGEDVFSGVLAAKEVANGHLETSVEALDVDKVAAAERMDKLKEDGLCQCNIS